MSYENACREAAESQGINRLVAELAARGVAAEIHQTGGFIMAAWIPLDGSHGVYANEEGATLYCCDSGQPDDECELVATSGHNVADSVVAFVKRWRADRGQ